MQAPAATRRAGHASCSGRSAGLVVARPVRSRVLCRGIDERALLGDNFGARDPTPGEIATNFADSGLTHWDTAHIIKPPEGIKKLLGLTARRSQDYASSPTPIEGQELELLRQQVPGWRVTSGAKGMSIRQEWKAKDAASAEQIAAKVKEVAQQEGHPVTLHTSGEIVTAELQTPAIGNLSMCDFITAAKVNDLRLVDLLPKKKQRFWA